MSLQLIAVARQQAGGSMARPNLGPVSLELETKRIAK